MAMTAAQKTDAYRFFAIAFNAAPGATYMSQLFDAYTAGMTTQQIVNVYTTKPEFTATYPVFLSDTDFATKLVDNIVKASASATNKAAAVADIVASLALGQTRGDVIYTIFNNLANKALTDADWGATAKQMANQVTVAQYYTETLVGSTTTLTTLQSVIANVTDTTDVSTNAAIEAAMGGAAGVGQTFTLTVGADTKTGGNGNDTFDGGTVSTLSAFDNLDGGAGNDTLTAFLNAATVPGGMTIKNIETATINNSAAGMVADVSVWTGLTKFNYTGAGNAGATSITAASTTVLAVSGDTDTGAAGTSDVTIVGGGGASTISASKAAAANGVTVGGTAVANAFTSLSVSGGEIISIQDRSGASAATGSTLTTVSIDGAVGDQSITSNGLTTLNLTKLVGATTVGDTTVTAAAGTRALTVTYNGVDVGGDGATNAGSWLRLTDAEATSLNINSATAKSYDVDVVAAKATAVTIAAAVDIQLAALTTGVATTVAISGAGKTTITADTLAAAAVITSTSTGGVTLTQALTANQQYVGTASSGVDTIGVATGFTKAITTGAGDDVVTYGGPATGGTIDGGDGTDTLSMTAAAGVTATATATFAPTVSNFEKLSLAATAAAAAINMANADGINYVITAGGTDGLTVTGAAANFTLEQTAAITAVGGSIALASDVGTSDTVNLVFKAADGFTNGAFATTVANVENLAITTSDTAASVVATAQVTSIITAAAAKSVTISGDIGFDASTGLNATTITSLDASGLSLATASSAFGGLTWTAGALAASSVIKGSAVGTNVVTFSAANTASTFVTYTGGSGTDTVTGSNGLNNVVDLGNGTNAYTQVGAGNATVTGGTGADTISVGTGANTVNVGGGTTANSVTVGAAAGLNVITTTSTGVDTFVLGAIQTAAGYYSTLNGWAAGDIINVAAVTTAASAVSPLGAKITLGGASSFANYLDAAAASATGGAGAVIKWFQFTDGNTYLVVDNSNTTTFADGVDSVICLTGLVNLATSTVAADVITLV